MELREIKLLTFSNWCLLWRWCPFFLFGRTVSLCRWFGRTVSLCRGFSRQISPHHTVCQQHRVVMAAVRGNPGVPQYTRLGLGVDGSWLVLG